jgi:hypothetical protein
MATQPGEKAEDFRVIAPSTKRIRTILIVLACVTFLGGLITLGSLTTGARALIASRGLAYGATLLVIGALAFGGLWLWLANVRLLIGRGCVGYRNILRRNRFWSNREVACVVDMAINYGKTSQPQRGIYLFGPDGKRLLALNPRAWAPNDLRDFVDATGLPIDFRPGSITAKEARREFPKAFGWAAQHVMIATSLTMLAAFVLVLGGYAIVSGLLTR